MPIINDFRYRKEIDGLRALAVLIVVLFHAGLGCPGGFVGVDVFFVISGYLITSLIWKDLESGCFSFVHFWERRARRIVPAVVVVTMATLATGWFVMMPFDYWNLGLATVMQAVGAANFYYWRDSGYFTTAADERPLLHTWSLAVEEQFYLVVPLAFWIIFQSVRLRNRVILLTLIAASIFVSLLISIVGVARYPWAAFFLLPARAWELLLGSLLAFLPEKTSIGANRIQRECIALLGLLLILLPVFVYSAETPFPGLFAVIPCSGAALLIWATGRTEDGAITAVGRLLSLRPFVIVGMISYSLYLWHWPFLAFGKYLSLHPLSLGCRCCLLALASVFAILSWRFVEIPFRERKLGTSQKSIFAYTGAGIVTVLTAGTICILMQGLPNRLDPRTVEFANARFDKTAFEFVDLEDIRSDNVTRLGATDSAIRPEVFIWGDSHAAAALPAFDMFLKEKGIAGQAAARRGTAPLLNWNNNSGSHPDISAPAYNEAVIEYVDRNHFRDVFLIGCWKRCRENGQYSASFNSALLMTVRRVVESGARAWIVMDVPFHQIDVPKVLSRCSMTNEEFASLCLGPEDLGAFDGIDESTIKAIQAAGGRILDPKPQFLNPTGEHYVIQANGTALYLDTNHLTKKGAQIVLVPFLRESLSVVR